MNTILVHDTDAPGSLLFVPKDANGFPLQHPASPCTWGVDTPGIVSLSPSGNVDANPCQISYIAPGTCIVSANDGLSSDSIQVTVQPGAETNASIEFTPGS